MLHDAVVAIVENLKDLYKKSSDPGHPRFRPESGYHNFNLDPANFIPIDCSCASQNDRCLAFVDGGNIEISGGPNFSIQMNRIYFNKFRGTTRILPVELPQLIEYFSITKAVIQSDDDQKDKLFYETKLIPLDPSFTSLLPSEEDLKIDSNDPLLTPTGYRADISRFASIARRFSEWNLVRLLCEHELHQGDIVVMDGTLSAGNPNEFKYAQNTTESAHENGVILTGLAKTSRIYTNTGRPLISAVVQVAEKNPHKSWYIPVAESISSLHMAKIFVAKLHPNAKTPYRFEINIQQVSKLTQAEVTAILNILAFNATDYTFPGYPYGLIDADQRARISYAEVTPYRTTLDAEISKNATLRKSIMWDINAIESHKDLNELISFHE